jgi:hypothetical protein
MRYTLLSDGSSDRALMPILTWLIRRHVPGPIQRDWADLRRLPSPPKTLAEKIDTALTLYPCDLLFVHRDAENQERGIRAEQIQNAREASNSAEFPAVCVVPVRMTEAWLLFDADAIRQAAGNPNGQAALQLPDLSDVEDLPDPKSQLHELLRTASERSGRRLKKFQPSKAAIMVPEFVADFGPLRTLPAFAALERELQTVLARGLCS